jgi:hypothetical protein
LKQQMEMAGPGCLACQPMTETGGAKARNIGRHHLVM